MMGIILAGGKGSRMKSITRGKLPKEMLVVGGVPVVRYPLKAMRLMGVKQVIIVMSPEKGQIIDELGSGKELGVDIRYVSQDPLLGMGSGAALLSAKAWLDDGPFALACGDVILCDLSRTSPLDCFTPLLTAHNRMDCLGTVSVHPTKEIPARYGLAQLSLAEFDGGRCGLVKRVAEKPNPSIANEFASNRTYFIMTGYYIFRKEIIDYVERLKASPSGEMSLTDALVLALSETRNLYAVVHGKNAEHDLESSDFWDIGEPNDYLSACENINQHATMLWGREPGRQRQGTRLDPAG